MEPAQMAILAKALVPLFGVLITFGMPVAIIYTVKHFKLRHRELELEAEMHGKQTQSRLSSIEARLGVIESALGVIARGQPLLQERMSMPESPEREVDEPARSPQLPGRTR
jgi:hypothetical protein